MLEQMPEVTELHPVPDAHVPVMKFKFSGVSIDLLYAKLSLWVIPEVSSFKNSRCWDHLLLLFLDGSYMYIFILLRVYGSKCISKH